MARQELKSAEQIALVDRISTIIKICWKCWKWNNSKGN